ncbi:hypothetical protein RUND412_005167 [Rhizina undulata]
MKTAALLGRRSFTLALTAPVALSSSSPGNSTKCRDDPDEETTERRMLQASEDDLAELRKLPRDPPLTTWLWKNARIFIVNWVIEPMATGFRFIYLVSIFLPVIFTVPAVYIGKRIPERSHERLGTLLWYSFLIWSMERAGPTFIKVGTLIAVITPWGQWAASRTDIFPTELCEMMSKLHSNVRAHPLAETKKTVSQAFGGREFDTIFDEFDETPLGAGAIAQVYRAKLKPDFPPPNLDDNKQKNFRRNFRETVDVLVKNSPQHAVPSSWVAVKVLHPKVEKVVHRDLRIMRFFAEILNAIPTLEWLSFPDEVDQFSLMMRLQMDLRLEAANLARFRNNFKDRTTVTFPTPYLEYTTREVLIEEFVHGIPLSVFLENGGGSFQQELADMGLDAFLHMLIMDNFIHADLHPGNIMVRFYKPPPLSLLARFCMTFPSSDSNSSDTVNHNEVTSEVLTRLKPYYKNAAGWNEELSKLDQEGYRPQVVFIDTGLVTELNNYNRRNFLDLFRAVAEFDGYRAGKLMIERSRSPGSVIDGEVFALKVQHLVLAVKSRTLALGNIKIGDILNEILHMVRMHHVRMEGDFINVVLSMLLLEGIGRSLDPNIDLLKSSLPMLRSIGTSTGAQMVRGQREESEMGKGKDWDLFKVWMALETRQFLNSSVDSIENLVKYDLLSPNI